MYWTSLEVSVRDILREADDHAYILAPFIQQKALAAVIPEGTSITVVTSWREDHLLTGVSSLKSFDVCVAHGRAALYIHPNIHLKLYGSDITRKRGRALVGSANVTDKGLGIGEQANRELLVQINEFSLRDQVELQKIISESRHVDEELYAQMKKWLDSISYSPPEWDKGSPLTNPRTQFLVTELPLSDSPTRLWDVITERTEPEWWEDDAAVHDLALFGGLNGASFEEFLDEIRARFRKHAFVGAFLDNIDEEGLYFGRIKEWVQRACQDVPVPKRRELTKTVQALIQWVTELYPEEFEVVRPSYSECLRRKRRN